MRDPSGLDVLKSIFAMPDMECYGNEKLEGLVAEVLHGTIPSEWVLGIYMACKGQIVNN